MKLRIPQEARFFWPTERLPASQEEFLSMEPVIILERWMHPPCLRLFQEAGRVGAI
jgi:hypothetical protein